MKKTLRFDVANDGTFQILTTQELKIICGYELNPPDLPEILFIKSGWSLKNRQVPPKPELHARLGNILAGNRN